MTATLIDYGHEIEFELRYLIQKIEAHPDVAEAFPPRWLAIKLLEQDASLHPALMQLHGGSAVLIHAQISISHIWDQSGEEADCLVASRRYEWAHAVAEEATTRRHTSPLTRSDRLDQLLTHRWLGLPLFMLVMWWMFKLTADVTAPMVDWVDAMINGPLADGATTLISAVGWGNTWLESLLVDGILAGVGGVVVFVPVLLTLYFSLALLEDSGYMARAAFVMNRLMSRIGLHGKSFLPLVIGFGCNVPAIYATRTLENRKDRILTALLVPFMSCGARLPVYVLFAAIFFGSQASLVIFGLYVLGIVLAVVMGLLLRRSLFQADSNAAFVMELPPYRWPSLGVVWRQTWLRTRGFLHNAATIILGASVLVWLLMALPTRGSGTFANTPLEDSAFAATAEMLVPFTEPLGFGSWEATGALVSGFVAKEVVVSTLAQAYTPQRETPQPDTTISERPTLRENLIFVGQSLAEASAETLRSLPLLIGIDLRTPADDSAETSLISAIRANFNATSGGHGALAALAFMVFVLLYTPCMATLAAEKHELGNKWMWFSLVGQLALAWLMALIVFQAGRWLL